MKIACSIAVLASVFGALSVWAGDNMKAYAPAEKGMVRHVLNLPKQDDEYAFKVELIAGKTVEVDEENTYFFTGSIKEQTIEGWGFPRYDVDKLGVMAGTLRAIDPSKPRVSRFIKLGGDPFLVRYNSLLPVVVYAPKGVEVRYRIWHADPKEKAIDKG